MLKSGVRHTPLSLSTVHGRTQARCIGTVIVDVVEKVKDGYMPRTTLTLGPLPPNRNRNCRPTIPPLSYEWTRQAPNYGALQWPTGLRRLEVLWTAPANIIPTLPPVAASTSSFASTYASPSPSLQTYAQPQAHVQGQTLGQGQAYGQAQTRGRTHLNRPSLQLSVQGLALIDEDGVATPIPSSTCGSASTSSSSGSGSASSSSAEAGASALQTHPIDRIGLGQGRPAPVVARQPLAHPTMSFSPTLASPADKDERNPDAHNAKSIPPSGYPGPGPSGGTREWSTGLCAFEGLGTFCKAVFCPWMVYAGNKARLEDL
ncbi:unnamed protein product [Cyclocybe aegerita]|uniref:Uncharacterized protein n=1 Tax=Cyclocybe aegerita TaxID=1973307 RepID=A0A8S0WG72_CYCAE|nr:unnamed protein product [Cyclocybe aegerita]